MSQRPALNVMSGVTMVADSVEDEIRDGKPRVCVCSLVVDAYPNDGGARTQVEVGSHSSYVARALVGVGLQLAVKPVPTKGLDLICIMI